MESEQRSVTTYRQDFFSYLLQTCDPAKLASPDFLSIVNLRCCLANGSALHRPSS
ncbi:hypothetical protein K443DRAFT_636947 [Laccaria amethystina LaAM-08-1]|uniref:Uncharacterized protein n=1 Tax=Laccaria amethystina LaAM-08-1 TaxID=1095629 RepID=A0A0C9Y7D6_9AGAR|nr:hypothetical protein K443DRAFT_636947 [Laccaria amethystina LaAM-08-1]